jgi:pimeloyl-ACP methyl ester carboxylesterase
VQICARVYGSGAPLIILHGLFGSWENWHPVAKALSGRFTVHVVDQRNHGNSFHSDRFDYDAMAEDIRDFMSAHRLAKAALLGHSMGGKTAMRFAAMFPAQVEGSSWSTSPRATRRRRPTRSRLARLDLARIATSGSGRHLQPAIPDPAEAFPLKT